MPGDRQPNTYLADLLREAGWTPETLARKVTAALSALPRTKRRSVHAKTPYGWLRGEIPHEPVPDQVARVLADALGHPVDPERLWPGRTPRPPVPLPADHGLCLPWDAPGLLRVLGDWEADMLGRRRFAAISGAALTSPAWQQLDKPAPDLLNGPARGRVREPVVQLVEDTVARAQQLDDQHGGALDFVTGQFGAVVRILRRDSYDTATGRRLSAALAQLAQTAGFMAYEARQDGDAQRWYLTGLRAAHAAADRPLAASILSLMSNQAAAIGKTGDALQLAAAAHETATGAPATVRALVSARSGLAHAAAGDLNGFQRTRDHTLTLLAQPATAPTPRWAYYASPTELDAIAGRGLVTLARRIPARSHRLIATAEPLLAGRALADEPAFTRSAVRHSAWLALAHAHAGDLDQALTTGHHTLDRLPAITSTRILDLLRQLRTALTDHTRHNPAARDFRTRLDPHLSATREA